MGVKDVFDQAGEHKRGNPVKKRREKERRERMYIYLLTVLLV